MILKTSVISRDFYAPFKPSERRSPLTALVNGIADYQFLEQILAASFWNSPKGTPTTNH